MSNGNTGVVAIIDDDDDVADVLGGLLEIVGYEVETYRSGNQFIAEIDPGKLACIVVDQHMPHMTGLEMLTQLGSRGVSIPSVLITGAPNARIVRKATELGVMKVLQKPMSHHELLRFIECSMA
jgi:two-component system CheB/CheR fusion protein